MKRIRYSFLPLVISMLLISVRSVSQTSTAQSPQPEGIRMMRQVSQFFMVAARKLGIDILIIDRISLKEMYPVFDTDGSVSKQDLLNMLIAFLHARGALLVKSGTVCQIVSSSRDLGGRWSPIMSLADIPFIERGGNTTKRIQMNFENASLSDFCAQNAKILNLTPIVIGPAVEGSVTLQASAISREALFAILMTVLDNNDAVLVESAGEYQIVPKSKELSKQWQVLTDLPAQQIKP